MSIETFLNGTKKTVQENAPSILAALAAGGVVTVGFSAYKFGYRYGYDQANRDELDFEPLTGKEKFTRYWKPLMPTLLVGAATVTCIVASTAISNRRNAALAGLVTLGEVTLREYKDKVREIVTKPKVEQIDKELAQESLNKAEASEVVFVGDGDILMYDTLTGRLFRSTKLAIEKAEVEMGRRLLHDMYISQNEWYAEIGLSPVSNGDDHGWNHNLPLEVKFIPLEKDDRPVLGLDYRFRPETGYDRFG